MTSISEILEYSDFVEAPDGEKCECGMPAIGNIEWWNYGDDWDFPASDFLCEKHLIELAKNLNNGNYSELIK